MIKVDEALKLILDSISVVMPYEEVPLPESLGRILYEDITADIDLPPFDNSAMDGYAVRAEDIKNASFEKPVTLEIIDEIPAGYLPKKNIQSGEASLIMTGAQVPEGADCVVIVEHTLQSEDINSTKIFFPGKRRDNIRFKGEDIKKGEKVLEAGILLKPSDLGLLAGLGKSKIKVSRKPVVAILSSGDELVDINEPLPPGKIRSSNTYMLAGLITKYGCTPVNLGKACDTKEDLMKKIESGKSSDVIITTGGISVGKYDVVRDTLESLGGEFKFWKVAMKPGKPLAFCMWEGKPVFGLPGNPISSFVSFEQFVRPALLKISGRKTFSHPAIIATLDNDIVKKTGIKYFARGRIYVKNNEFRVEVVGPHGSNMLKPLSRSNGLIILSEESTGARQGEKVEVQIIDEIV